MPLSRYTTLLQAENFVNEAPGNLSTRMTVPTQYLVHETYFRVARVSLKCNNFLSRLSNWSLTLQEFLSVLLRSE